MKKGSKLIIGATAVAIVTAAALYYSKLNYIIVHQGRAYPARVIASDKGLTGMPMAVGNEGTNNPILIYGRQNRGGEIFYRQLGISPDGKVTAGNSKSLIRQDLAYAQLGYTQDGKQIVYGGNVLDGYSVRVIDTTVDGGNVSAGSPREVANLPEGLGYKIVGWIDEQTMSKLEQRIADAGQPFTGFPTEELQELLREQTPWDSGNNRFRIGFKDGRIIGGSPNPKEELPSLEQLTQQEVGVYVISGEGVYFPKRIR